jgi:hypothetical protein
MLASFSGKWFLHSEKDIGGGTLFLILRFRAQTHVAKGISNYRYVFLVLFTSIYFPFLNYLNSNSIPFPHPPLYITRFTVIHFFPIPLLHSSYNPFPSFLLSTHSLLSLIFLCTFIVHIPTCFPLCRIYSASPSSFNWFPLPPGRHVVYSCSSAAVRWPRHDWAVNTCSVVFQKQQSAQFLVPDWGGGGSPRVPQSGT